jgi:hypothetical protein
MVPVGELTVAEKRRYVGEHCHVAASGKLAVPAGESLTVVKGTATELDVSVRTT